MSAISVGLVGSGWWARGPHAAAIAQGPETALAGVWARDPSRVIAVARLHGARAFTDYDDLLAACDAVYLAVDPAAQPILAVRAARARRHLLLEKPLARDVAGAQAIVAAVEAAGVGSLLALTFRFGPRLGELLREARRAQGARVVFTWDTAAGGPFARGWRARDGVVLDAGPHVLDILDAALGPFAAVSAAGDPHGRVELAVRHVDGRRSTALIGDAGAGAPPRTEVVLTLPSGNATVELAEGTFPEAAAALRRAFAAVVRGTRRTDLDARRGLVLQRHLEEILFQLGSWESDS